MPVAHTVQSASLVAFVPTVDGADVCPELQFSNVVAVAVATVTAATQSLHPVVAGATAAAPAAANCPSSQSIVLAAAGAAQPPNVDERPASQLMHEIAAASVHFAAAQLAHLVVAGAAAAAPTSASLPHDAPAYVPAAHVAYCAAAPAENLPAQHVLCPSLSTPRPVNSQAGAAAQVMGAQLVPATDDWKWPAPQAAQPASVEVSL